MTEEADFEQLHFLHPNLRPYVKILLTYEFGLLKDLAKIHSIQCGAIVRKYHMPYGDRFQLRLLYCKKTITWQVLMNGEDITKAPDFIMEEDFLSDATADTYKMKVPSLINWCPSDINCLLNVILELLELYKEHQVNLLRMNPSLQRYLFEYDTLVSMANIKPEDVEVCIQNSARTVTVTFLIHLNVDFSKLPTALPDCKNLVVLVVEFKDNAKNTIQLMPRMELEDAFGGALDIPDLVSDMSLMDYVPRLEELLQNKVEEIIDHTYQRKMLYSYLVQFFEPAMIEGDNINFQNISFLLELNDFFCVLNVHIPSSYPDAKPVLQLLSLQKSKSQRSTEFNSYRFNQNMSHEEVARSIYSFVKDTAITEFQKTIL